MDFMSHCSSFLLPSAPVDNKPSLTAAELRLCADGGANRLYDELPELFPDEDSLDIRNRCKPDVIKGDMDSIRSDVLEFYLNLGEVVIPCPACATHFLGEKAAETRTFGLPTINPKWPGMLFLFKNIGSSRCYSGGTKIVDESHDQDTTDLHKCVSFIQDSVPDKSNLRILVTGALGGRFDHEIGNINVLFRFSNIRIVLISDDCLIYLLPRTHRHEIHILSSVEGPHCGLIPIGVPSAKTTTTGLQWDLNDTEMRFGGLISTSNLVQSENITVQSDSDLLWTISIKKPI